MPKARSLLSHRQVVDYSRRQSLEAERIYRAIFRREIPEHILDHFLKASTQLAVNATPEQTERYYRAIEETSDLEALEVACRCRGTMPLLPLKFRLMIFLAETVPENQRFFVNEQRSYPKAMGLLTAAVARCVYKACKGFLLAWRTGHA